MNLPITRDLVQRITSEIGIPKPGCASIREIVNLVNHIEKESGIRFIRMEMGVPGLKPPEIAINAEIEALKRGVASIYPPIEGVASLKDGNFTVSETFPRYRSETVGVYSYLRIHGGFLRWISYCEPHRQA